MKFTIDRNAFVRGLKFAASNTSTKTTMQILGCVHIRSDGSSVSLTATDLIVGVTSRIAATVAKSGATAVDGKAILDRVSTLAGDTVTIESVDDKAIDVSSGRAKFRLPTMRATDYPKIPTTKIAYTVVSAADLDAAISAPLAAVSHDETRFHLAGVYVCGKTTVATDGHRMIVHESPTSISGIGRIVTTRGVTQIVRLIRDTEADEVSIAWDDQFVFVTVGDVAMSAKLVDAQFPPWEQALPSKGREIRVDRSALTGVIARAIKVTGGVKGVTFSMAADSSEIAVTARNDDRGEYSDAIEFIGAWTGKPLAIHFNPNFLADAASGSSDDIVLRMPNDVENAELHPIVAIAGPVRGVVMPMRAP